MIKIAGNLIAANITIILVIWFIAALILYTIIRIAVRNGVREANRSIEERLDTITLLLHAITREKYKDQ